MEPVALTRISGVVNAPDGDVTATELLLRAADDSGGFVEGRFHAEVGERGEFGFSFVPAGRYTIDALRRPTPEQPALAATVPLVVEPGTPRDDVEVRLAPGPRFTGQVQVAAGERFAASEFSRYAVVLIPLRAASQGAFIPRRQAISEDGGFDLPAIVPGEYSVVVLGGDAKSWFASSLMVYGRDVLDSSLTLTAVGRDVTGAVLTLASRRAEVTGFVRNAANVTTSDGYVIAFSTDRTLWTSTRRTVGVKPDTDGQYRIPNLPPGDYYLISADGQAGQWRDPAFLETLVARAERVDDQGRRRTDPGLEPEVRTCSDVIAQLPYRGHCRIGLANLAIAAIIAAVRVAGLSAPIRQSANPPIAVRRQSGNRPIRH